MSAHAAAELPARLDALLERRLQAAEAYFGAHADRIAALCRECAERFEAGGRLIALGTTPAARSDVRHVAVEFVHPVIVGKRALPALGLASEGGPLGVQVELEAEPGDMVMAFGIEPETATALALARGMGCLTIGFEGPSGAEWSLDAGHEDPFVHQELVETTYHVMWELVHVFFEHRAAAGGGAGASDFLYPFLAGSGGDEEAVLADVARSVRMKAAETGELRARTLREGSDPLVAAARAVRERLDAGGRVLALGNGGSATDAMDAVADLRYPPGDWPARRALDLTEDPAILTALANDIGADAIFARQVIAHGRTGDVLLAISTSGGSANVISALAEARRRGMATVALVGYDGGRILSQQLADFVVVSPSQHVPRIQEAQASALHALRELVELCA